MLWSIARFDLGLSTDEFYALTPRQFHALLARKKERDERAELLNGINTSVLANHATNQPKKAYKPFDFMPSRWHEREQNEPKPKRFTRQGLANHIRGLFNALPADRKVIKKADDA